MRPRLFSVIVLLGAVFLFIARVEGTSGYIWRNGAPLMLLLLLVYIALRKGGGTWTGAGWRWPLAALGFAIPSIGLSLYLHCGYLVDRNGMVSQALFPELLFEFLPLYTIFAGAIGFAIGWIAGRNI